MLQQIIKLKGIYKDTYAEELPLTNGSDIGLYEFREWAKRTNPAVDIRVGYYKVKICRKIGKGRNKLKTRIVHVYNKYPCECCGPYYVAEIFE